MGNRTACKDHMGNIFVSQEARAKAYGLNGVTVANRLREGWALEESLTTPLYHHTRPDHVCTDHLGNKYQSLRDMCDYYKMSVSCYQRRRQAGMSLEECLTTPLRNSNSKALVKKYTGENMSLAELARQYNIDPTTLRNRIVKFNYTVDEAIKMGSNSYVVTDHLGHTYKSITDMCLHYGITYCMYKRSIAKGLSLKETLTKQYRTSHVVKTVEDHLGNSFPTVKAMCAYYNVPTTNYFSRLRYGWTVQEALCGKEHDKQHQGYHKSVLDHLGNQYDTIADMARAYKISPAVLKSRLKNGWNVEQALYQPVADSARVDHRGIQYQSTKQMCDAYHISVPLFCGRISRGYSIEEALTLPRNMYVGEYRVAECLKRLNVKFYHDCTIKTVFTDLKIPINWDEFLMKFKSKLGKVGYNWSKQKIQSLRPDFVLYTDEDNKIRGVIEFDGEQHQNFIELFFKTIEEFYKRCNADFVKQSFWEYMNIPMLRIRHDQIDMINDMVKDFIDNPQNYIHNHNTYLSEDEYWSILAEQKQQLELAFAV